eukprot:CAMPEP_0182445768 /NCGR_PEP_ID=MMETSP1172-20130603/3777_1 /TAXON_ID=708627 /ORGANISM="Timspurckia oligopyrenoides, Strain CCMP3278" /LENGTH=789 /DNA_ID=CAMNT_0024641591 /DNA_START=133 /DNA_END=2502 /DNA_ORIENTATION=-
MLMRESIRYFRLLRYRIKNKVSKSTLLSIILFLSLSLLVFYISISVENQVTLSRSVPEPIRNLDPSLILDDTIDRSGANLTLLLISKSTKINDSFKTSLESWLLNGLVSNVQEIIVLLYHPDVSVSAFQRDLPERFRNQARVLVAHQADIASKSEESLGISDSRADSESMELSRIVLWGVALARSELILYLDENDQLVEPIDVVKRHLEDGKRILLTNTASAVRYKHRWKRQFPELTSILYQNREQQLIHERQDSICESYAWLQDPMSILSSYIHSCRNAFSDFFCSEAKYCRWVSSAPTMFRRSWALSTFTQEFIGSSSKTLNSTGFAVKDFDRAVNSELWSQSSDEIAFGEGLFMSSLGSIDSSDTLGLFEMGWMRYLADLNDWKRELFVDERGLKESFEDEPERPLHILTVPSLKDRFPVSAAELIGSGTSDESEDKVDLIHLKNVVAAEGLLESERNPVLDAQEVPKSVPIMKAIMNTAVPDPLEANYLIVTALFGFTGSEQSGNGLNEALFSVFEQKILPIKYPKVVFCDASVISTIIERVGEDSLVSTQLVGITNEELYSLIGGYDRIQSVIEEIAKESDQSLSKYTAQPLHAVVELAKIPLLLKAAQESKFISSITHALWVDTEHPCIQPGYFSAPTDFLTRIHTLNTFLMIFYKTSTLDALDQRHSGIEFRVEKADELSENQEMYYQIRSDYFGGPIIEIEILSWFYLSTLRQTLDSGSLLTLESLLYLVKKKLEPIIHAFDEQNACLNQPDGAHTCDFTLQTPRNDTEAHCALFKWSSTL